MTAGSGGAASRCRPVGSRDTYDRSSPGEAMSCLSRRRSTSDSGARVRSGARSASVPKSGLRSTARTRRRRWLASTLPVRKVLVVLPQPPLGDRVATMFVRDTPGRRAKARLELCLLALASGDEEGAHDVAQAIQRRVRRGLAVDDRRVVEVVATRPRRSCRLGGRGGGWGGGGAPPGRGGVFGVSGAAGGSKSVKPGAVVTSSASGQGRSGPGCRSRFAAR